MRHPRYPFYIHAKLKPCVATATLLACNDQDNDNVLHTVDMLDELWESWLLLLLLRDCKNSKAGFIIPLLLHNKWALCWRDLLMR